MRWWPAGDVCPRQRLILFELLRSDAEEISTAHACSPNDTKNEFHIYEKTCMAPAHASNDDTKNESHTSEKICMVPARVCKIDNKNELHSSEN